MSQVKEKTVKQVAAVHPKYRIGELLRKLYGELNVKQGVDDLANHCSIRNKRTVVEWMAIEAGSSEAISHLLMPKVLQFFGLQKTDQVITPQHKILLIKTRLKNAS